MKFIIFFFIYLTFFSLFGQQTIFQVGNFNFLPKSADAKLCENEFSVLSGTGNTIHVNKKENFPQRLAPGQRVAIFMDAVGKSTVSQNNNLLLTISVISEVSWEKRTPVTVLFNNHPIWKAVCTESPQKISAIIPATYFEKGNNVIQIRNEGMNIIAFDALKLESLTSPGDNEIHIPGVADTIATDDIFDVESKQILIEINSKIRSFAPLGIKFQCKLLKSIPYKVAQYFQFSGQSFNFMELAKNKEFFDPFSGKPRTIPWELVKRLSPLFEGNPEIVPCNLLPVADDDFIRCGAWSAVRNSEGVISVLCASYLKEECGKEVKIILPLRWSDKDNESVEAELKLINGFHDETSPELITKPLEHKTENVKITNGVFEYKFKLTRCSLIRIVKNGTDNPPQLKLPQEIEIKKNKPTQLTVSNQPIPSNYINTVVRYARGRIEIHGSNYIGKTVDATRGTVYGIKNVVPMESQSSFVEISYPDGISSGTEGALMYLGNVKENFESFSFWVYPKTGSKEKKVTLKFYFNYPVPQKELEIYQCILKTEQWQRIAMTFNDKPFPRWGSICILGDPSFPEYRKGAKVSFEFNGFCVLEKPNPFFISRIIEEKRKSGEISTLKVLFLGRPGKSGEIRYAFKDPVEFKKMSLLAGLPEGSKPELTYLKDAQILQIKHKFPNEYNLIPDEVMQLLTAEEKSMVTERAFLCAGIKIDFE